MSKIPESKHPETDDSPNRTISLMRQLPKVIIYGTPILPSQIYKVKLKKADFYVFKNVR